MERIRKTDGEKLRAFREEAWLSQEELAARAGVSRPTITDIETNKRRSPRTTTILALAEALEINPSQLLEGPNVNGPPVLEGPDANGHEPP